jgi:uncharacterized protein (DUF4213/DUF364 family)
MSIRRRLKEIGIARAQGVAVADVRIGLIYTAVYLDNGRAGLAYTFLREWEEGCRLLEGSLPLCGKPASELIPFLDSQDRIESAVGLATCNALFNFGQKRLRGGDVLEFVRFLPEDSVGMVGHFAPLVPALRERASSLKIFERIGKPEGDLLPEMEAYRCLRECQVAFITSTSIVNGSIDPLLKAVRSCREVVLLGATTPMIPEAFTETPVTVLSGVVVTEPLEILRVVSEGGGMRIFKNHIRKVNIRLQ